MAKGKFVAYYRVSTARQGRSGLGLEAQQQAVHDYLNGNGWEIVAEHIEVESGKENDRPELEKALAACRLHQASLVIAKLDRLSRNAEFLLRLQNGAVPFVAADMPEANEMVVGIMAVVAQAERKMISQRTKAALAAAKARGTKLGGFRGYVPTEADRRKAVAAKQAKAGGRDTDLLPIVEELRETGVTSLRGIAAALNERSIPAPMGGTWHANSVSRLLARA